VTDDGPRYEAMHSNSHKLLAPQKAILPSQST